MPFMLKKSRRPSTVLYEKAETASRMESMTDKEDVVSAGFVEDATGGSERLDSNNVRWLLARAKISSWERWLWFSATVGLTVLCVVLGVQLGEAMGSPPSWKSTDLVSARQLAVDEERTFYTSVKILDNGTTTFPTDKLKFMGPPSQDIDDAWNELLQPQIVGLSDEEAGEMKDLSVKNEFGKRIMSLQVYHSLHCVNMVRKSLDFDYYYKSGSEPMGDNYRDHIYHCLDDLRQAIMCHGDLTPVPFYWDTHMQWPIGNTSQLHTCRKHETVRAWAMERRIGHGGSPIGLPVHQDGHENHL